MTPTKLAAAEAAILALLDRPRAGWEVPAKLRRTLLAMERDRRVLSVGGAQERYDQVRFDLCLFYTMS